MVRWQIVAGNGRHHADAVLIAALAAGATVQDAANQAGVAERTVYRRLDDPSFRAQIEEARRAAIDLAVARLSDAAAFAATTLRELAGAAESETVRLGACRTLLELALKWREHGELTERIAALEQLAGDSKTKRAA